MRDWRWFILLFLIVACLCCLKAAIYVYESGFYSKVSTSDFHDETLIRFLYKSKLTLPIIIAKIVCHYVLHWFTYDFYNLLNYLALVTLSFICTSPTNKEYWSIIREKIENFKIFPNDDPIIAVARNPEMQELWW